MFPQKRPAFPGSVGHGRLHAEQVKIFGGTVRQQLFIVHDQTVISHERFPPLCQKTPLLDRDGKKSILPKLLLVDLAVH